MSTTTAPDRTAAAAVDWQLDRLDLDAYLARVGVEREPAADLETLRVLHRAHADRIPFENLDILLGRGIHLDLDRVQDKLVARQRGGYCFEHNSLFGAVLEDVGFVVSRHLGRVKPSNARGARTHMLLRVDLEAEPWLADVGFGASLLEPIPLREGISQQGAWTYRLERDEDGWLLSGRVPGGWTDLYEFTLERQRPIDFVVPNHYTATHPDSPFTAKVVALRTEPEVQYALRGALLTTTRPDDSVEEREVGPDDLVDVLAEVFGIGLDDVEARELRRLHAAAAAAAAAAAGVAAAA